MLGSCVRVFEIAVCHYVISTARRSHATSEKVKGVANPEVECATVIHRAKTSIKIRLNILGNLNGICITSWTRKQKEINLVLGGVCVAVSRVLIFFLILFPIYCDLNFEFRDRSKKMALLKAAVLIYLAIVPLVSPLPVPQTAENKGRGRSYPLIISQYSNVRNSKFDSPPATEAPAPIVEPDSAVSTKVEDAVQPASDADIDTEDAVADAKKVIEIKTEEVKSDASQVSEQVKSDVESETEQKKVVEEDNKKTVAADEVIEKTEKTVESEQPSAVADAPNKESTTGDSKNESILAASDASDASIVEPLKVS